MKEQSVKDYKLSTLKAIRIVKDVSIVDFLKQLGVTSVFTSSIEMAIKKYLEELLKC